jgi:histone H3/H4
VIDLTKNDLRLAAMHRIIKKAGAERVSDSALTELRFALEDIGLKIAKEALDFTKHARRKTVRVEDIQIAVRKVLKE